MREKKPEMDDFLLLEVYRLENKIILMEKNIPSSFQQNWRTIDDDADGIEWINGKKIASTSDCCEDEILKLNDNCGNDDYW